MLTSKIAVTMLFLFVFLGWIFLVTCDDNCRSMIWKEPKINKALMGHALGPMVEVPNPGSCRVKCYLEPNCVSINVGPLVDGKHTCQLNNADEKQPHSSLKDMPEYTYLEIENQCSADPCVGNMKCQSGYTSKGFGCTCAAGFTGPSCTEDINECLTGNNNCHPKGICENAEGSFQCKCRPGFSGNGVQCLDINECATDADNCHPEANCENTDGSFNCKCKPGFIGNGKECFACVGKDAASSSCYVLFKTKKTWYNAKENCSRLGSHLVKIESADENEFIRAQLPLDTRADYWIGLTDEQEENKWKWSDGTDLGNYTNWGGVEHKQPNDKGHKENCVGIRNGKFAGTDIYSGQWHDKGCGKSRGYLCEKEKV